MNLLHERPDHIEFYLITVRTGAWFSWTDYKNKTYANLIVVDGGSKPSEKECMDGLASLQAEWDKNNAEYIKKRRSEYSSIEDQLDMLYKDIVAGKLDTTGTWATHIKAVKDANPKPS